MPEIARAILEPWSAFYAMTGASAASLTGLMFVVITLVTGERMRKNPDGISTFSTPTVLHFSMALLASAILSAPWRTLGGPAILLAITGLFGVGYVVRVMHKTRHLQVYSPDLEDWTWYTVLPLVAYGAITSGAGMFFRLPAQAPFAFAGGVALLILIGIHNAWDVVTYIAVGDPDDPPNSNSNSS